MAGADDGFARVVRRAVEAGEIAGATVAMACPSGTRIESFGLADIERGIPMQPDSIFRLGSTAKAIFATAGLILLEDRGIDLDRAITDWLPELADRRVLKDPRGPIDNTVAANRQITLRDVLTFQLGIGIYLAQMDTPIMRALLGAGIAPQRESIPFAPDEFVNRLASLPLAHQPGETFMYHLGDDVLRILIGRISGQPLEEFLGERVFAPLGMADTGCFAPADKRERLTTCYFSQQADGVPLKAWDTSEGRFSTLPTFPNQLVSTARDYLAFTTMLLNRGEHQGRQVLSPNAVTLMMTDQLSDAQKARSPAPEGFWQTRGWGMGATVYARDVPGGPSAGSYSWFGGDGPHFLVDPERRASIILMVPREVEKYSDTQLGYQFERDCCAALDLSRMDAEAR